MPVASSNPDVVVIGAGAAGIGAGLALARLGVPFLVLEAKDRAGGRGYSESHSLGHLWDHGCHWLHSADINPLRAAAETIGHGFQVSDRAGGAFNIFMDGKWSKTPVRENYVWRLLDTIAEAGAGGRDVAALELLDPADPLYPMIRHWVGLMYSADPENVSTRDAGNYTDTGANYPVRDGYGALLARLAAPLAIELETPARRIDIRADGVAVETPRGTIAARAAILAVPARMIETARIALSPALPDPIAEAFAETPMGWYEKIAFAFDRPVFDGFDPPYSDVFDPVAPDTEPVNFELHPFGRPIAVGHIGGSRARDLAAAGDGALTDFALTTLKRAFGGDIARRITRSAVTHWTGDPFIGGAYSCARPGKADLRRRFAETVHERLFLAGEHVHPHFMATAHGAYLTGIEAAHRASALLGYQRLPADPLGLPEAMV